MAKANFEQLDRLTEEGYLRRVESPCGRLVLYNYTDKCVYDKKWNKYTLNSRGTVYELSTGRVVARAFPKFFNFEELPMSKARNIAKKTDFEVYEKVDGSLGVLFFYNGEWYLSTRGSFTSDQAVEGKKILEKYDLSPLDEKSTYLVEIIYPENKIIVDYGGERKLVLLGAYKVDGREYNRKELEGISYWVGMEVPNVYNFNNIDELIDAQLSMGSEQEGFVVKFSNNERVKFKSKEYLKLARLLSHVTPVHFWEHMYGGEVDQEVLKQFPEEFRDEVDEIVKTLEKQYRILRDEVYRECSELIEFTKDAENQRKAIGLKLNEYNHGKCAFAILDGDVDKIDRYIMKAIRPKGNNYTNINN